MTYTTEELAFILYNNRSINGVVKNFIPSNIDVRLLVEVERRLDHFRSIFDGQRYIEIERCDVNETADDVFVYPKDIKKLTNKIKFSHWNLDGFELDYLTQRGINRDIINRWRIGKLSYIQDNHDLEILNATCHPVISPIIKDGIEGGGIIIPLFKGGELINCAIRKLSDIGKLKYSLACPDIDVWEIDYIEGEDIWMVEGLFDMMALRSLGIKAVSASGTWSGIQIYKILEKKPLSITILCDNDNVGLKTGFILHKVFNTYGIPNRTLTSELHKDAAEHIFQNNLGVDKFTEINITLQMIDNQEDNFDFLKYLKNRKF